MNVLPRIYEENPAGPPIFSKDRTKTSAALGAVIDLLRLTQSDLPAEETQAAIKQISCSLRETTGMQWTLLTAMQYLTGQRADKSIRYWSKDFAKAGLTLPVMDFLVAMANDFCANGVAGKTLSAGLLVAAYQKRPLNPSMVARILELPEDVIQRIEASV